MTVGCGGIEGAGGRGRIAAQLGLQTAEQRGRLGAAPTVEGRQDHLGLGVVGDQLLRLLEVGAGLLRIASADQLSEADEGVGGLGLAVELDEDLRLQLERAEVARVAQEDRVEVPERVLEHLVLHVDAGLEQDLVDVADALVRRLNRAAGRHVGAHGSERARRYLLDLDLHIFDIDVEIDIAAAARSIVLDDVDVEVQLALVLGLWIGGQQCDLGLDLAGDLADVLGVVGVPLQRLAQHAGGGLLVLAPALALLAGQLHHHADRLVDLADGDEGLTEQLKALHVGRGGPQQRVQLDQRAPVLALLEVDLRQRAQDREVVLLVIDEALGDADVVVGPAVGEQALGSQAEVLDGLRHHALARVELGQAQALAHRGRLELGDHAEALEALGDLAGLEVGLGDELVGRDSVTDAAEVLVQAGDAGLDVEAIGVDAEDLAVHGDRLLGLVGGGVALGDVQVALDGAGLVARVHQRLGEQQPRARVAGVGLDDRDVLLRGTIVLALRRELRGRRHRLFPVERHPRCSLLPTTRTPHTVFTPVLHRLRP